MLFVKVFSTVVLAGSVAAIPFRVLRPHSRRDVDPNLVPSFGWQAGVNPDGECPSNITFQVME